MAASLLGKMSADLLFTKEKLSYLIRSAPYRYKVYEIPKRSGTGKRIIAQPAKVIKNLQYWVIDNIFNMLPVHQCATAYIKGKNILTNAKIHADKPYLLKLDFKNFFPSIKGEDFYKYAHSIKKLNLSESELELLMRLLFWRPNRRENVFQLSIGAPTSPYLSNAIMYDFDVKIYEFCVENRLSYTRYADDIAFSMHDKNSRSHVLKKVKDVLASMPFPKLRLNTEKTIFGSMANRRFVTGLILSNDGKVSLGRDRKRRIQSQIHYMIHGKLTPLEKSNLQGMLSFAKDIEPDFFKRMEKKYGEKAIRNITLSKT